jgi:hypothetical protein
MPYIVESERKVFDEVLNKLDIALDTKGKLEYCIFKLMRMYMRDKKQCYSNLHDTAYAAEHCADEFRRRFLDPHEDGAKGRNGDVY